MNSLILCEGMTDAASFSKIAVVLDRDDKEITDIEAHASSIFQFIDDQINSVEWEKSEVLSECFKELIKI